MLHLEKKSRREEATIVVSSTKVTRVPYRNHEASCEKLWFVRSLYQNLPQMGQKNYHGMLVPFHDSMPTFLNFKRVLDLLEFQNQVSQHLRLSQDAEVLEIHSHFLHGT